MIDPSPDVVPRSIWLLHVAPGNRSDQKRPKEAILASPLLERDRFQSGTSTETALALVAVTSKTKVTSVVNLDRPML